MVAVKLWEKVDDSCVIGPQPEQHSAEKVEKESFCFCCPWLKLLLSCNTASCHGETHTQTHRRLHFTFSVTSWRQDKLCRPPTTACTFISVRIYSSLPCLNMWHCLAKQARAILGIPQSSKPNRAKPWRCTKIREKVKMWWIRLVSDSLSWGCWHSLTWKKEGRL